MERDSDKADTQDPSMSTHNSLNNLLHQNVQPAYFKHQDDEARSLNSSDEDSDLEHELEADRLLLGGETRAQVYARGPCGFVPKGDYSPDRGRQVYAETPRFDLVSPYKRLRLDDLTQSSMESSQAAGEGEAHSLLQSCDDDFNDDEDDVGSACRSLDGHAVVKDDRGPCLDDLAAFNPSDTQRIVGTNNIDTQSVENVSQPEIFPEQHSKPITVSQNKATGKKKKSFFTNLFGKSTWRSRDPTKPDHKHKMPLKDVRNIAWSHIQQHQDETTFTSGSGTVPKTPSDSKNSSSLASVTTMLTPQEMRASIPYIDELCMEEDPFMSADEREFPPPPAVDKDKRSSVSTRATASSRVWDSGSVELYCPDYQTLETRQICMEPNRGKTRVTDDLICNNPDTEKESLDVNVYDEIAGDEDVEDFEEDGDLHQKSNSENRAQSFAAAQIITTMTAGNSNKSVSTTNIDQDVSSVSAKSAKSVGTSCVNIPATLQASGGLENLHNIAAPSECSAFTAQTYGTLTSDDISGVYDSVDTASEAEDGEHIQTYGTNDSGKTDGIGVDSNIIKTNSSSSSRSTVHLDTNGCNKSNFHIGTSSITEVNKSNTAVSKVTMSSGVSTQGLWEEHEITSVSRYISEQELPAKSRSFESAFEKKPSSAGSLHQHTRSLSMQHLPNYNQHYYPQKLQSQHHDRFHPPSSTASSSKTHGSNPHLPVTTFPYHPLDVVVEQPSPKDDEDLELPSGASAKDFNKATSVSQRKTSSGVSENPHFTKPPNFLSTRKSGMEPLSEDIENMLFPKNSDTQLSSGNPCFVLSPENPDYQTQAMRRGAPESTEAHYPYCLDEQQQRQRFHSEDDLQQYLHQVEVQNYLQQHQELAQLHQDIENAGPGAVNSSSGSKPSTLELRHLHPQPHSTGSLLSHQSSNASQNSAGSHKQSTSTGSLRRTKKASSSSGSLKQHSSGSLHSVQGRSVSSGQAHHSQQHVHWSSGSVHHQSRTSSQGSTDRSNQGASTSKKAVLQSSGRTVKNEFCTSTVVLNVRQLDTGTRRLTVSADQPVRVPPGPVPGTVAAQVRQLDTGLLAQVLTGQPSQLTSPVRVSH
ncbi:hypothetical protein ElyMa_003032600 [Elysia marginata]|uniref:Uncharacterized protein n=1 Tax=Elysia marginata TaxID=1093978 RepID=A0AAV4IG71_9GAST|nr:hypothetical protein ElyMa_003032600 [Elysia marginata]